MTNKIIQKIIAGIIVNLLILQTLPVVSAEELVTPVSETPTTVNEPVVTEPITDATVEPAPDQSIPGDEVAPTETTEPLTEPSLDPAPDPASAPTPEDIPQYNQLMRQVDKTVDFTFTENSFYKAILQNLPPEIKEEKYEASVENVTSELEIFIDSEKEKLADSDIDDSKKEQYFNQLEKQLDIIEGDIPPEAKPEEEVKIAPEPSSFTLDQKEIEVEDVEDIFIEKNVDPGLMEDTLKKLKLIQVAEAYVDNYMPVLEDLQDDGSEIIINQEIRDLAAELEGNPVKIFNFVRNNIDYEPYYGAKKNSTGCLRERVCNDVDTASLTIALMRASGIPARYKKSLAIVDVAMLKELLGVEQTQTIFKAMQSPLFTVDGEHDFDAMTKLAVQWVHPEIFYPYDERSGNFSATAHPEFADINEMRAFLREFNDNQWIPVDAAMKSYTHTANEIVSDTEDFDTENFWQEYLEYQGESSPIQQYEEELGLDPENEQTRSGKVLIQKEFDFLPYTLPYLVAQGNAEGNEIAIENFSSLPDVYKNHVTISLLNPVDDSTVFSHTFTASEVNNTPIDLYYQGFTDLDETTIVEHGGVHATPAALVDIKPLLVVGGEQYEGNQPLQIGQSLLLQFEYPEFDKVDQKFSIAGNQEGIYMYFSKLQDDQFFDDEADPDRNSKILLEGNAMMAREYLRKVEDNTDTINAYLDYDYDVAVHRAVVTQKRILNELDEIATTFDFKGLSIDASLYGNGYSNRGPLETHSDDFSLLWLLYASYYESQLFTDLTGLNAISTVTGLQYAYGNPDQYDVITVTSDNSNIIDDLDFSDNTKANMRADIAEGATIITPDRPIQKENWRGVVYISRLPDGVDNYSIGEQAEGNGGEMIDPMILERLDQDVANQDFPNGPMEHFKAGVHGNVSYTFTDKNGYSISCSLPTDRYAELLLEANDDNGDRNWMLDYGWPCLKGTKEFGSITYSYIIASHGAKFFAGTKDVILEDVLPYKYWKKDSEIESILKNETGDEDEGSFHFDTTTGTYMLEGNEGAMNIYYEPTPEGGEAHVVEGEALMKFKAFADTLGFPIKDKALQNESIANVRAAYFQKFIGGQIYEMALVMTPSNVVTTFYVPGKIAEFYSHVDYCRPNDLCASAGILGFPLSDPVSTPSSLKQDFEQATLVMDNNFQTIEITNPSKETIKFHNEVFAKKVLYEVFDGQKTDIEAFANIADHLASVSESDDEFVDYFSILLLGTDSIISSTAIDGLDGDEEKEAYRTDMPYQVSNWSDTGFKFIYNDSHYCMKPRKLDDREMEGDKNIDSSFNFHCTSDQLYHSIGGFAVTYNGGVQLGMVGNDIHEYGANPLGFNGSSEEDRRLTDKMINFALGLDLGLYSRDTMGDWIIEELAKNDYDSSKISRQEVLDKEKYRMKFRVFEYEQNGNKEGAWSYSKDMQNFNCGNGTEMYYQDYTSFKYHGVPLNYLRIVAVNNNEKLLIIPFKDVTKENICNNLNSLIDSSGYSLKLNFTDPDYYGGGNTCAYMLDRLRKDLSGKPDLSNCALLSE